MGSDVPATTPRQLASARERVFPAVVVWSVWLAMTIASLHFVHRYARNVPYYDDFELIPMMTGRVPVDLQWAWSQHNEHRPMVSRLILAGSYKLINNDFRTGMYINVGLLSVAAASILLLARRMRGRSSVFDAALPLVILNPAQVETYLIGFALNLVLTTWIAIRLLSVMDQAAESPGWRPVLRFGVFLAILPLCGGSGVVMLPPLLLWLWGYVTWRWWSDRQPGALANAIGVALLMVCSAVLALYLNGYSRPRHHPPAPSVGAAAATTMEYLSLVVPKTLEHRTLASIFVALLTAATLTRLLVVAWRAPNQRPRVFGFIAMIGAMLLSAASVGFTRSGFGPGMGMASRYVTTVAPLFAVLYIAWLAYGPRRASVAIHAALLLLCCLAVQSSWDHAREFGRHRLAMAAKLERGLDAQVPASELMKTSFPELYADPLIVYNYFKELKAANFGKYARLVDDIAPPATAEADQVIR